MANPGYPMQPMGPGGPPMGPMGPGGPMGMRPSGPMPGQMPQMRRGTPKAVPVIVSAGLAVGVFCGLLFGLGTGDEAKADTKPKDKQFVGTKIDGTEEASTTGGPTGPTPPKSVTDNQMVTGTMKEPKTGSAAPTAGSAAGSAATVTVPVPTIKMVKLAIIVKPDAVKDAKITVDGTEVAGGAITLPLGDQTKKDVTIAIKAPGYKDLEQKLEVDEGEMKVEYQLVKKSSSSGSTTPKRPDPPGGKGTPGSKKPPKKGGGGLIDI
jgi:hypothetical protein